MPLSSSAVALEGVRFGSLESRIEHDGGVSFVFRVPFRARDLRGETSSREE